MSIASRTRSFTRPRGRSRTRSRRRSRTASIILTLWLVIGVLAAVQRGYFAGEDASCTKFGTMAITIAAGPLNYLGVNPRMNCETPQPSR